MYDHFESQLMSSAITASQKFFNKGILVVGLDETLTPTLAFRTSSGIKTSRALTELSLTWGNDLEKVAKFIIEETKVAYSANLFNHIQILQ